MFRKYDDLHFKPQKKLSGEDIQMEKVSLNLLYLTFQLFFFNKHRFVAPNGLTHYTCNFRHLLPGSPGLALSKAI